MTGFTIPHGEYRTLRAAAMRGEDKWDKVERRKDNWTLITAEERNRIGRRFRIGCAEVIDAALSSGKDERGEKDA